jgi:hypothetical protein
MSYSPSSGMLTARQRLATIHIRVLLAGYDWAAIPLWQVERGAVLCENIW